MKLTTIVSFAAAALLFAACSHEATQAPKLKTAPADAAAAGEAAKPAAAGMAATAAAPQNAPAKPAAPDKTTDTPKPADSKPRAATTEDSMYGPKNLTDAKNPKANEKAPDTFKAKFETTAGDFVIEVHRDWSPNGADRFYNLVHNGYFTDVRFFRVVPGFMAQFGIHGDPKISAVWSNANLKDDPVKGSNTRGMVTFAKTGMPNSRSTQLFINFGDNKGLDAQGFSPFGQVIEGMESVDKIYAGDLEKPSQGQIQSQGNAYLDKAFPKLTTITKATILP